MTPTHRMVNGARVPLTNREISDMQAAWDADDIRRATRETERAARRTELAALAAKMEDNTATLSDVRRLMVFLTDTGTPLPGPLSQRD